MCGIDNLMRPGVRNQSPAAAQAGRRSSSTAISAQASDFENLPPADWVIDAAANPSVLAGVQSGFSSRQLFEHNLASLVQRARILQGDIAPGWCC